MSIVTPPTTLKPYPASWQGTLLLACRKCQKKLKKHHGPHDLANLKKSAKASRRTATPFHVLPIPCQDLCPKDAVTVCLPTLAAGQLFILRSADDLHQLLNSSSRAPELP